MATTVDSSLKILSWNITRRCNLSCNHCYLPAAFRTDISQKETPACELSTEKALQVIDQAASVNPEVMLILSGGEPLLRNDVFDLAQHASHQGMMVVLGTNGTLLDNEVALRLRQSGVSGVSISLDSVNPEIHDWIRLMNGSWQKAVKAVEIARTNDLSVQINTVVSKSNYDEIPDMIDFARSLGANVFSPFFLVCTGRGEELTDITPEQYENILSMLANMKRKRDGMMVRTRCAPTFRRILYQSNPDSNLLKLDAGKCMAGIHYCRISPEGAVTPCPYMPVTAGNIKSGGFAELWDNSDIFRSLRSPTLKGKCRDCEFHMLCGGCRARAYAKYEDMMNEDPWCVYSPRGCDTVMPPVFVPPPSVSVMENAVRPLWTRNAENRLKRVPYFVRPMVRGAVEKYAMDKHYPEITPEIMAEARQNFNMSNMSRS